MTGKQIQKLFEEILSLVFKKILEENCEKFLKQFKETYHKVLTNIASINSKGYSNDESYKNCPYYKERGEQNDK